MSSTQFFSSLGLTSSDLSDCSLLVARAREGAERLAGGVRVARRAGHVQILKNPVGRTHSCGIHQYAEQMPGLVTSSRRFRKRSSRPAADLDDTSSIWGVLWVSVSHAGILWAHSRRKWVPQRDLARVKILRNPCVALGVDFGDKRVRIARRKSLPESFGIQLKRLLPS